MIRGPVLLLLIIGSLLLGVKGVRADSLVLDATAEDGTGAQIDAAAVSPESWASIAPVRAPAQTYVVQPGETLSTVAAELGLETEELAAWNEVVDQDALQAGQILLINPAAELGSAVGTLPDDSGIAHLHLSPWPPAQGDTITVRFSTRRPVSVTLSFAGETYPVVQEGRRGWALVPAPALAATDVVSLSLSAGQTPALVAASLEAGAFLSQEIPASASDPILGQQATVAAEAERMRQVFAGDVTQARWSPRSRLQIPLAGEPPRTSPFGTRRTYGDGSSISAHDGEDFSAPPGTPVLAPASGEVVLAEPLFVRGNAVVLSHGNGVFTGYWHLSALSVAAGDIVEPGQQLGQVGSTGLSTGAHLHWEMRVHGVSVDPMRWLASP